MGSAEVLIHRVWLVLSLIILSWLVFEKGNVKTGGRFQTIEAERINIRESDGTLRMVISNRARQDGGNIEGLPIHDSGKRPAGIIFFNDVGDETGGLIFGGKSAEGAGGSLTFDRWKNDQTVQIFYRDSGGIYQSGMIVSDRPNDDTMVNILRRQSDIRKLKGEDKTQAHERLMEDVRSGAINPGTERVFAGTKDGVAQLALRDGKGRVRIRFSVESSGGSKMEFFDGKGKVIRQ